MEVVGIEAVAGVDMDCRSRCMYTMVRFSNMGVFFSYSSTCSVAIVQGIKRAVQKQCSSLGCLAGR